MAILVSKTPQRRYQAVGGIGLSQGDRERADRLDEFIEKEITELVGRLDRSGLLPKEKTRGTIKAYWLLGRVLQKIANSPDFGDKAELPLLWRNIKLYVPDSLLYKERGPYREHLWYCFRLGSFPFQLVKKMNWGEWVTIFDSGGINQEQRFDGWFGRKLEDTPTKVEREWIRIFAPCVNELLGNIDTGDLSDRELSNCYETAWQIVALWHAERSQNPSYRVSRADLQSAIAKNLGALDSVMEGRLQPPDLAEIVIRAASG